MAEIESVDTSEVTPTRMNFAKATGTVQGITGKKIVVVAGRVTDPPHTDHKRIVMGESIEWQTIHRYGVLIHESCHILFPAEYDKKLWQLCNMIDDCRIERQFIAAKPAPHYADALRCLAVEVIANRCYAKPNPITGEYEDPWEAKNFKPFTWALLFFRSHMPEEVKIAASDALREYAKQDGSWDKPEWQAIFNELVTLGMRITRLKNVSTATLTEFCTLYVKCFPNEIKEQEVGEGSVMIGDSRGDAGGKNGQKVIVVVKGKGQPGEDEEGAGDAEADADTILIVVDGDGEGDGEESDKEPKGEGEDGQGTPPGQAPQSQPLGMSNGKRDMAPERGIDGAKEQEETLDEILERLKARVGKVGTDAKRRAQEAADASEASESMVDENQSIEDGGGQPGEGDPLITNAKHRDAVDKSFIVRFKVGIRKLRCIAMDSANNRRKQGRLHLPTVIKADHKGIPARYPFNRTVDELTEVPVACAVATDFSGSTEGQMNRQLNRFTHNALYALQCANCECAGLVWNSGAQIIKTIDDTVSAVVYKNHDSDGGTSLMAACQGSVDALKRARSPRKVAFIFTDGAVYHTEVPAISAEFQKNGFEAVLLVSLGSDVPRHGIVDTAVCRDLNNLNIIFDGWVRKTVARGVQKELH